MSIANRNEILKLAKAIRSEIMHPELRSESDEIDLQTSNLIDKKYNTKIKIGPAQPTGMNMFKRDTEEQRKCIVEAL